MRPVGRHAGRQEHRRALCPPPVPQECGERILASCDGPDSAAGDGRSAALCGQVLEVTAARLGPWKRTSGNAYIIIWSLMKLSTQTY